MRPEQQLLTLKVAFKRPLSQAARLRIQTKLLGLGRRRGDAFGINFWNRNGIEVSLPTADETIEEIIFLTVLDVLGVKNAPPNIPIRWDGHNETDQPKETPLLIPIPEPPARLH